MEQACLVLAENGQHHFFAQPFTDLGALVKVSWLRKLALVGPLVEWLPLLLFLFHLGVLFLDGVVTVVIGHVKTPS